MAMTILNKQMKNFSSDIFRVLSEAQSNGTYLDSASSRYLWSLHQNDTNQWPETVCEIIHVQLTFGKPAEYLQKQVK
jgi:hypothetical protein